METGQELTSERDSYTLVEKIGEGGFGVTWGASRKSDGERVVIKQLRLERLDDWKSMELFEREARVLRGLAHPHIVGYIDDFAIEEDGAMVLVQRFVPGETLLDWMQGSRPIEATAMARWFHQILDVCAYLHGLSPPVIHRDISPKNIIFDDEGHATLIDFGTVQAAIRSASSISSTSAGTFGYASMEQMIGRAIPQSDLYGLGMTFIAVATGRHPEDLPL
jgi:serine/threonine protein kinase